MQNKIVFVGCLEYGINLLKALVRNNIYISYIVCINPKKAEEQNVSGYFDFGKLANELDIPIYYCEKYSLKSLDDELFFNNQKFSLLIQGGWNRLFPDNILKILKIGAVGVHGSSYFLPKGRGRSPLNWSIIENKKRFILHFFIIKQGIDDGDVFHYEMFDINDWDDIKTLYFKNTYVSTRVLLKYIPQLLKGAYTTLPQVGEPTYYPKRSTQDGLIEWHKSMIEVFNLVKGVTKPYPGAFSFINKIKITIWKCQPFDTRIDNISDINGQILEIFEDKYLVVKCNDGLLLITEFEYNSTIEVGDMLN